MSLNSFQRNRASRWVRLLIVALPCLALIAFYGVQYAQGQQTFDSGSTGADGALNYPTPGNYNFDPKFLKINAAADNIFNFTTITIASGVNLRLTSNIVNGPIYWLASGNVRIDGTIDLTGGDGAPALTTNQTSARVPSVAGSGGYGGGLGGMVGGSAAQPGNGPGFGKQATTTAAGGLAGMFSGNQFLVPLVGGSGGGGGLNVSGTFGGEGGAGGGALLIASSTSILVNGSINADGGQGGSGNGCAVCGGAGAGGSIHLVAPSVSAQGLYARGGKGNFRTADGKIRIDAFSIQGFADPPALQGALTKLAVPSTPPPTIIVTAINGRTITANPFVFTPDATINTSSPVTVSIEAHYVPLGTVPQLYIISEAGPDQTLSASALGGTLAVSTSSAQVTFPAGNSRGFVKAIW